jgi:hypothetical protein
VFSQDYSNYSSVERCKELMEGFYVIWTALLILGNPGMPGEKLIQMNITSLEEIPLNILSSKLIYAHEKWCP